METRQYPLEIPPFPFGMESDLKKLRKNAQNYCKENLRDVVVVNQNTKLAIRISMQGVKHTLSNAKHTLINSLHILKEILEKSEKTAEMPDKLGRPDIVRIHQFQVDLNASGITRTAIIVVREMRDGTLQYYDHGFLAE